MPRHTDLHKILLIGSGPIVIGQGCEFDYSGVQACKALREEGYQVVLVNSNPATIMTDPEFADRTYIEPITAEVVEAIIDREKPDAILPTMGGQTALNVAMELNRNGALARHNVRLIGANAQAIAKGEDRQLFKQAMLRIGLDVPRSGIAHDISDAARIADEIGSFPVIIRPAFTLGGSGGGIAYNREELEEIVSRGLALSPVSEVLIEESLVGWKEFEMEVMRDCADNCVVVCSIENLDPMGVHTGDSITVAPTQTLSDREFQLMRDASFAVIREIGVETGGSNIQFAVNPENGRMVVIEMNPRVSRSSALASKATGFPIAKIAAKLAVGYTLDEIRNDITRETPASFEPTIDYCVVKVPRFTFEKFPQADPTLTTQMKSVGEAMAIGRTFKEALQKALRSLEVKRFGLCGDGNEKRVDAETLRVRLNVPNAERIFYVAQAFQDGMSVDEVFGLTKIDPWFLHNIEQIVREAEALQTSRRADDSRTLRRAKKLGFSDRQLAVAWQMTEQEVRALRKELGIIPTYRLVDTCAAEFEAYTPYYYSTYGSENEMRRSDRPKIMILGGGPNRIGQGIEFDYCCVHAAFALRETRIRNHHGELESGNGFDRLRHERQALLRAAHARGCAQYLRSGAAGRRDRAVRRADAAESRGWFARGGRSDPRDAAGEHREGGRPEAVRGHARQTWLATDTEWLGRERRGSGRGSEQDWLPGAGAAIVCSRRPRDGAGLQRGRPAPLHAECDRGQLGSPGAGRSLPGRCDRGRRRLHCRRRDRGHRCDHGTRATGRHPQRRQRLRDPDVFAFQAGAGQTSRRQRNRWRASWKCAAS